MWTDRTAETRAGHPARDSGACALSRAASIAVNTSEYLQLLVRNDAAALRPFIRHHSSHTACCKHNTKLDSSGSEGVARRYRELMRIARLTSCDLRVATDACLWRRLGRPHREAAIRQRMVFPAAHITSWSSRRRLLCVARSASPRGERAQLTPRCSTKRRTILCTYGAEGIDGLRAIHCRGRGRAHIDDEALLRRGPRRPAFNGSRVHFLCRVAALL